MTVSASQNQGKPLFIPALWAVQFISAASPSREFPEVLGFPSLTLKVLCRTSTLRALAGRKQRKGPAITGPGRKDRMTIQPQENVSTLGWQPDYSALPESLRGGMQRYLEHHIEPGGFLSALLSNDLEGAVRTADADNILCLPYLVHWLSNEVPMECWGSRDRFRAWVR